MFSRKFSVPLLLVPREQMNVLLFFNLKIFMDSFLNVQCVLCFMGGHGIIAFLFYLLLGRSVK